MAFLTSLDSVRAVEWSRKYLWDMAFDPTTPAPAPFNSWFPAVEVDEDVAILESHTVEGFLSNYKIPLRSHQKHIKITMEDDQNNVLSQWFSQWINVTILQSGLAIAALNTSVKLLHLIKQNSQRITLTQADYLVYPEGDVIWNGTSNSGSQQFTVNFVIASVVSVTSTSALSGNIV